MKKIIVISLFLSFFLTTGLSFSQHEIGVIAHNDYISASPQNDDGLTNRGAGTESKFKTLGFKWGFANKVGENTYWVKNAIFNISENKVIDFGLYLKLNHSDVIDQVPAINGYILEVNEKTLNIWIASETGTPASDEIEIIYNE